MLTDKIVNVVGGGLAGCEVALQLATRGVQVKLHEMKPIQRTPAQTSDFLADLVCYNSFRSANPGNAIGQLKREMSYTGSFMMKAAVKHAVPAGDALAVDRDGFAEDITDQIAAQPGQPLGRVLRSVREAHTHAHTAAARQPAAVEGR